VRRWGHVLAEGAVGKGLGSRALLAALKGGAVMHDASYWCPLQLRGRRPDLLAALRSVRSAPCIKTLVVRAFLPSCRTGARSGHIMSSCTLANSAVRVCCSDPAQWTSEAAAAGVERDFMLHAPGAFPRGAIAAAKAVLWDCPSSRVSSAAEATDAAEGPADSAEVLLWVHPAGYSEALAALQACCTQQGVAITDRCWTICWLQAY
jgi:ribonuclease P/MRP protein subunit POP1